MSERKPYIDVARGILILLVVLFHTPFILRSVGCVGETPILDVVASFYIPFFMPAFFVITGMCTDWDADWKTFLVGNAKKLLLPALLLPLCKTALYCERSAWYNFCDLDSWAYACVGWFVCALMTAKFVYYGVRRLVPFGNSVLLLLAVAAIVMVGLLLNKFFCLKNTLYYQNGMLFVFFVYIGELSKKKMAIFWGGRAACAIGLGYIAVWLASRLAHVDMPYVMLSVNCGYWKFPLYLCIAGGGYLSVDVACMADRDKPFSRIHGSTLAGYLLLPFCTDISNGSFAWRLWYMRYAFRVVGICFICSNRFIYRMVVRFALFALAGWAFLEV